jgi:hypothetical protein
MPETTTPKYPLMALPWHEMKKVSHRADFRLKSLKLAPFWFVPIQFFFLITTQIQPIVSG